MSKCWRFAGQGVNNDAFYEYFACGVKASYSSVEDGQGLYLDGERLGGSGYVYRTGTTSLSVVANAFQTPNYQSFGSCYNCFVEEKKYDCVNAACTESEKYNTPGIYQSMSECETACGTGCSGQCIPNDEWSQIQSLANQLKNKNCS